MHRRLLISLGSFQRAEVTFTWFQWKDTVTKKLQEGKVVWCRASDIPLHMWSLDTFHSIAASFGSLKKIDKGTLDGECLSLTRLTFEVDDERTIPQKVTIKLGGVRFEISISVELEPSLEG